MVKAVFMLTGFVVAGCGILVPLGVNVYYVTSQRDFHELVELARTSNAQLATFAVSPYPAVFYLHCHVPQVSTPESLKAFMVMPASKHWLLLRANVLEKQEWIAKQATLIDKRGKWCLLSLDKVLRSDHS